MNEKNHTHFGYQTVPRAEKVKKVAQVFNSVASQYDLMNDLMSFGLHRVWKHFTVSLSNVRQGHSVLDVAGGTGDLTRAFARKVGDTGRVCLVDINAAMLNVGRDRLINAGILHPVEYIQANVEQLPFPDNTFDCITIAFGLRNVTDKDAALAAMQRVLKPGGQLLILEFSHPVLPLLNALYERYSFDVLPRLGEWVTGDAESYRYLVESIRRHPDQATLIAHMEAAGLEQCHYHNLTGGIVALHRGYKF